MPEAVTDAQRLRKERARAIAGLYAITPDMRDTATLVSLVAAAVRGGASAIQYRSKSADAGLRHDQASALKAALAGTAALFIINDDVLLAERVDADGVHLGEDDSSLSAAREHLDDSKLIGVSCYNDLGRAHEAAASGADYIAFGSFFASGVKPHARRASITLLHEARRLDAPVVAIGGIDAHNARALYEAGADAVAVISAVFGSGEAASTERAARELAACSTKPLPAVSP
ncbi:MAG: thiamine phosphate synthase [Pseudomonadota bacterium]|nr:thiamine phosphate synthase [Pseudomonadota bacterium]